MEKKIENLHYKLEGFSLNLLLILEEIAHRSSN